MHPNCRGMRTRPVEGGVLRSASRSAAGSRGSARRDAKNHPDPGRARSHAGNRPGVRSGRPRDRLPGTEPQFHALYVTPGDPMNRLIQFGRRNVVGGRVRPAAKRRERISPRCECLEDRLLLTTQVWQSAASMLWSVAANWNNGPIHPGDTLVFPNNGALQYTTDDTG